VTGVLTRKGTQGEECNVKKQTHAMETFRYYMNFRIFFYFYKKKSQVFSQKLQLSLSFPLGSMDILIILNLLFYENRMILH
jgi:hypothetical protein